MDFQQIIETAKAEVLKILGSNASTDDVKKATIYLTNAQYGISLEAPAKQLVPYLPTWAQSIPREVIATGNAHTYKRITKVSITGKSTAAEGTRGNAASITADAPSVAFGIISSGVFDVSLEAEKAAGTFDDLLARATTNALLLGRRNEAAHILGGTVTALGACTTIAVVDGGATPVTTFTAIPYYVNIKALTGPAMQKAIIAGACSLPATTTYVMSPVLANVDQTDGWGVEGTQATVTPTAAHSLLVTWDPNPKAAGYGVFLGTTTGIANLKLIGVTNQCRVILGELANASSDVAVTGDTSADANDFIGFIGLINASGSGAYLKNVGAALSAAVGNGIPEIDTALGSVYNSALGIDDIDLIMGTQTRAAITRKLGSGSATTLLRLGLPVGPENTFAGGAFANKYVHPITGRLLNLVTDPTLFDGVILGKANSIPYPMAEVPAPLKMWLSYDWLNLTYAVVNPKREYENRMRGGLAVYLPPSCFELYNIWN